MIRKNKSIVALITLLLVAVLASGCFLSSTKYAVDVTIEPKDAADFKGPKKVKEGDTAEYTLEIAEGYVYVDYVVDPEDVEVLVEDDAFSIVEVNEDIKLTLNFEKEDVEPPVDELEAAIEAAEEAIAALPKVVTLEDEEEIAAGILAADAAVAHALDLGAEEEDIDGYDFLQELKEIFEEALAKLAGHLVTKEKVEAAVKDKIGAELLVDGDEFDLPEEVVIEGNKFVLIWKSDSDLVDIDGYEVEVTIPAVDTKVILVATLGFPVGPQAIDQDFEVEIIIEGWVTKAYDAADKNKADDFKAALDGLELDYNEALLKDYMTKVSDVIGSLIEPEKTVEELAAIIADVDEEHAGEFDDFNEAIETYFTTNVQRDKDDAYDIIKAGIMDGDDQLLEVWLDDHADFDDIYLEALEGKSFNSLVELQAFVDTQNEAYLVGLIEELEEDIRGDGLYDGASAFFNLIRDRLDEDDAEDYEDRLDLVKALSDVFEAGAATIVAKLEALEIEDLLILDDLADEYHAAFGDIKDPVGMDIDIAEIVNGVNAEELQAAIDAVVGAADDDEMAVGALTDALNDLAEVAVIEDKDLEQDNWDINEGNESEYKKAIAKDEPKTALEIHDIVNGVNAVEADAALLREINEATTKAELQGIMQRDVLELSRFRRLPTPQREDIPDLLIARGKKEYEDLDEFKIAVDVAIDVYLDVLADFNEAAEAEDYEQMLDVLKEIAQTGADAGVWGDEYVELANYDLAVAVIDAIKDQDEFVEFESFSEIFTTFEDLLPEKE